MTNRQPTAGIPTMEHLRDPFPPTRRASLKYDPQRQIPVERIPSVGKGTPLHLPRVEGGLLGVGVA